MLSAVYRELPADPQRVTCFSYLAAVRTLHISHYPQEDYGVGVQRLENFVAGDGPIVAAAAAKLGWDATLLSNGVAEDADGEYLQRWLSESDVRTPNPRLNRKVTPCSSVVSTDTGSRTWFAYLPDVQSELEVADLAMLTVCEVAYVDCYEILSAAARRAVRHCVAEEVPVFANLGGSPVPEWWTSQEIGGRVAVLQTSVDERLPVNAAEELAADLFGLQTAESVVVTRGSGGAVMQTADAVYIEPALQVDVKRLQGAGSVFSAALITRLGTVSARDALNYACTAGSLWCAGTDGFPAEKDISERAVIRDMT